LNAELNPICHVLGLLGAHHILHVSRIRINGVNLDSNQHHRGLNSLLQNDIGHCSKAETVYVDGKSRTCLLLHKFYVSLFSFRLTCTCFLLVSTKSLLLLCTKYTK